MQILARLLDVLASAATEVELTRFEDVARLPLVGDGHGDDVQAANGARRVGAVAEGKHLDDAAVRAVVAILRATVALGDPDRLPLLEQRVADIRGELEGIGQEVVHVAITYHLEHLVGPTDGRGQFALHEVAAEGDLRRAVARLVQQVLQQRGVEHNVAVVGDEEVSLRRVKGVQPVDRQACDGAADDPQIDVIHDAHLELIRGADGAHHAAHLLYVAVRKDVTRQCVKGFTVGNALHGSGDLVRNEGTQVLKLIRSIHWGRLRLSINFTGLRLMSG